LKGESRVLSRVADSVYWMGRLIERAENVARCIDVNLHLTLDLGPAAGDQWAPLVNTTGDEKDFRRRYGEAEREKALAFLTFDERNPNSILSSLRSARENARAVRELISLEMWEELNKIYLVVRGAADRPVALESQSDFFRQVKLASHLLEGVTAATMSHNEAWHFIRLGRLVERADKTSRILDVKYFLLLPTVAEVGSPLDTIQWSALLKSASALEMYRKRHGRITPAQVVQFLLLDREFPRAVRSCLITAEESLRTISGSDTGANPTPAEIQLGRLRADLDSVEVSQIIAGGLHQFIDSFQCRLNQAGEAIYRTFFAPDASALAAARWSAEVGQRQSADA
jgi:uncharacterized alpha-E superfamily protein